MENKWEKQTNNNKNNDRSQRSTLKFPKKKEKKVLQKNALKENQKERKN